MMKAALLKGYNKSSLHLTLEDYPLPDLQEGDVLLKVLTSGVNPLDNMITRGEVRMIQNYHFPMIAGNEIVGRVEKTGKGVTRFKPGDRVYGRMPLAKPGSFAEYAAVQEDALARVPDYLTDEQAAAVPLTALTAAEALSVLEAKSGQTLFISGGTGGFGQMAIPLAVSRGIHVITNGSGSNEQRMLDLGVERFIDYRKEDYSKVVTDVDMVVDTLGQKETLKSFSLLKKGGRLVSLRAMPNGRFARRMNMSLFKKILFSLAGSTFDRAARKYGASYDFLFVRSNGQALAEISQILEERHITPAVDAVFPLDQVNDALDKITGGHSKGKTVLKVSDNL